MPRHAAEHGCSSNGPPDLPPGPRYQRLLRANGCQPEISERGGRPNRLKLPAKAARDDRIRRDAGERRLPANVPGATLFVHITMVRLMARRLARKPAPPLVIVPIGRPAPVPELLPAGPPLPGLLPVGPPLPGLLPAGFDTTIGPIMLLNRLLARRWGTIVPVTTFNTCPLADPKCGYRPTYLAVGAAPPPLIPPLRPARSTGRG
jgi:hypothetical protein